MTQSWATKALIRNSLAVALVVFAACSSTTDIKPLTTFKLEFKRSLPYLNANIEGQTTRLMFDLGADAPIALTESEISRLGVKTLDQDFTYSMADGSVFESLVIEVGAVDLNGWVRSKVLGHVFHFAPGDFADTRTGHIGSTFFKDSLLSIDYAGERVTVYPPGAVPRQCGDFWLDIELEAGLPRVPVVVNEQTFYLAWDTGAQHNFVKHGTFEHSKSPFHLGDIRLDSSAFRPINLGGAPMDGVLGYDFFAKHLVCINFRQAKIAVNKYKRK